MKINENKMTKEPAYRFSGHTDAWEQRKLGEVASLSSSKRVHLKDYVPEGIPFYRGSEISAGGLTGQNELFISYSLYEDIKLKYGVPEKNNLLITAVGTLGNVWKVDDRKFYYKDGNLILISELNCNTDFLYSYLSDGVGKKRVLDSGSGSNQKALTMVKLREVEVTLPTLAEQTAIGTFFQTLDRSIALHQRKLDSLKEQKKTYLQKLFPRNGETIPEIRFPEFQHAPAWEQRKLGEIADVTKLAGFEFTEHVVYSETGNIIALRGLNIKNGTLVLDDVKYIDGSNFSKLNRSKLIVNDIMFTYVGTVGELAIIEEDDRFYLAPNVSRIRVFDGVFPKFVKQYMSSTSFYQRIIFPLISSSSQPALSMENVRKFDINLPTLSEQTAIGNFFQILDRSIALHQRKLDKLKESKQTLLKKMFI